MLKKVLILGLAAGASASRSTLSASPSTDSDNSNAFPSDEELVAGSSDLPEYFDSRSAWFGCGLTVLDQVWSALNTVIRTLWPVPPPARFHRVSLGASELPPSSTANVSIF